MVTGPDDGAQEAAAAVPPPVESSSEPAEQPASAKAEASTTASVLRMAVSFSMGFGEREDHFTAPAPRPLRQNRCRRRKATTNGVIDSSAPTITRPRSSGSWLTWVFHW